MVKAEAEEAEAERVPLTAPNLYARPESINIKMRWPTSLVGGERPSGDKFGCKGL